MTDPKGGAPAPPLSEVLCTRCPKRRESPLTKEGKPRTPRGWKEIAGAVYCPDCKLEAFVLRAVSIPVAKCDWPVVMPPVRAAIADCVRCANWILIELFRSDTLTAPAEKLPAWKMPYLYPAAREAFPGIDPSTLVSLLNTVGAKYRASRWNIWLRKASLPVYKTIPLPLNAQAWMLRREEQSWVFSFRAGGDRHELTLRSGREFYRQHAALAAILDGSSEAGEAALYEIERHGKPGLMLRIAAWFPRQERVGTKQITARTAADAFLVAVDSETVWRLNGDHMQRWIVGAARQQQRLREDLKAERRFPRRMRDGITDRMHRLSEQRKRRMDSWMHEASAQLVNWTVRRGGATLIWDDTYPSMVGAFPWFVFLSRLEDKCRFAGITFVRASEGVIASTPPLLASQESR